MTLAVQACFKHIFTVIHNLLWVRNFVAIIDLGTDSYLRINKFDFNTENWLKKKYKYVRVNRELSYHFI